jgi:hypothetical protein
VRYATRRQIGSSSTTKTVGMASGSGVDKTP